MVQWRFSDLPMRSTRATVRMGIVSGKHVCMGREDMHGTDGDGRTASAVSCDGCGQPLEEWEVGLCERCGLSYTQHATAGNKGWLKTQYRVIISQTREVLTEWTDNEVEANKWLTECESYETAPQCQIQTRKNIIGEVTRDQLAAFAELNRAEFAWRLLAQGESTPKAETVS